jgi:hypothetical protein
VQHSVDGGLAVLLALRRWAPMVPGLLVVVVLGIGLVPW